MLSRNRYICRGCLGQCCSSSRSGVNGQYLEIFVTRVQSTALYDNITLDPDKSKLKSYAWVIVFDYQTREKSLGPRREKTCLRGFRQSEFQTSHLSYRD